MKLKIILALVLLVPALALVVVALVGKRAAVRNVNAAQDRSSSARAQRVPVLVELFTSEGCSSCPPADELLMRLEQTQPVDGAEVIALSEHVDYWNRLGWADPYSSSEFSKRQNDYARAFDTDGAYTPQMVVDGRAQFVGSDSSGARKAIAGASRDSKAAVTVSLAPEPGVAGSITLEVRVAGLPERAGESPDVLLAITESGLRSSVSRGENAGRSLSHTAVVRKLTALGSIDSQGAEFVAKPLIQIDKGWKRDNMKAVVFVQERASRRVLGAASVSLVR